MKAIDKDRGVFGVCLTQSLKYAHSRISYVDEQTGVECYAAIPIVIGKCGAFLKSEALGEIGIFRLSGNAKRISSLQRIFDTPDDYGMHFEWEGYTVHDAANVMRRFINHLPEPVITVEYQSLFKSIVDGSFPSIESKVGAFHTLIEQLPVEHQHLLLYLLDMLYMFSLHSDKTLMDRSALATSFSPGILLNPSDSMNPAEYKEAQRTLEFLIAHQHKFTVPTVISDQHLYRDQYDLNNQSKSTVISGNQPWMYSSISSTSQLIPSSHKDHKPPLRRTKTAPTKNKDTMPGVTNPGRWKSIKRIVNESL